MRRRAEHLRHKADTWNILSWAESALVQSARYAGHVARGHLSDKLAKRAQDAWQPKHDTTAWHLCGRAGLRHFAVMQAEIALASFAAEWASEQGLRNFEGRSLAADRQLWEITSRSYSTHTVARW